MKQNNQNLAFVNIAVSLVLALASPALGQYRSFATGANWNNPSSALLQTQIMNNVFAQTKPSTETKEPARVAALSCRPNARASMVEPIADKLGSDAEERQELRKLFAQFLNHFEKEARKDKMPHYVPRAAAAFIALNYFVAAGEEVKAEAIEDLRNRVDDYLPTNPQYRTFSDRQKQQLYETLVILGTLVGIGYNDGEEKKNEKQMDIFRKLGRKNLETLLGVPMEKLKFTEKGFIIQ